jgi:hypothetical protein
MMKDKKDRSNKQKQKQALKKHMHSLKAPTPAASADGSKSPARSTQKESESAPGHTVGSEQPSPKSPIIDSQCVETLTRSVSLDIGVCTTFLWYIIHLQAAA